MAVNNTAGQSPLTALKVKLLDKHPKAQGEGAICTTNCSHKGKDIGNMIRCCMCPHWFHIDCINLKKDESVGVWPCYTCRFITYDISQLYATINNLGHKEETRKDER